MAREHPKLLESSDIVPGNLMFYEKNNLSHYQTRYIQGINYLSLSNPKENSEIEYLFANDHKPKAVRRIRNDTTTIEQFLPNANRTFRYAYRFDSNGKEDFLGMIYRIGEIRIDGECDDLASFYYDNNTGEMNAMGFSLPQDHYRWNEGDNYPKAQNYPIQIHPAFDNFGNLTNIPIKTTRSVSDISNHFTGHNWNELFFESASGQYAVTITTYDNYTLMLDIKNLFTNISQTITTKSRIVPEQLRRRAVLPSEIGNPEKRISFLWTSIGKELDSGIIIPKQNDIFSGKADEILLHTTERRLIPQDTPPAKKNAQPDDIVIGVQLAWPAEKLLDEKPSPLPETQKKPKPQKINPDILIQAPFSEKPLAKTQTDD